MKYNQEKMSDVIGEIKPLLEEHYLEIAKYKDIPLVPDWGSYEKLDELGIMKIFTCRSSEDNKLLGYSIYFVKPHLHYSTCLVAMQDILFILPEYRGRGLKFIVWCDEKLKEMNVNLVVHHVKAANNFGPALERIGYELMDLIYTRRI